MAEHAEFERLSYNVKPINYEITFIPNMSTFKFIGHEIIKIEVSEKCKRISMNARNIVVKEAKCNNVLATISYDEKRELVHFDFDSELQCGMSKLYIEYVGELGDNMCGFYRSVYKCPGIKNKDILCTQFESCDARRALPCWDEPDRKATFDVSLVVTNNLVALSNMPEIKRETATDLPPDMPAAPEGHQYDKITFSTSPKMSTYLLAMVVGEFDHVAGKDPNGVDIRVFTPPGRKEAGEFALDVMRRTLPFYEEFFGIRFPLPKIDLIAIPDFASGAMENWGLVTYRETALLIDSKESSLTTRQNVALVVGHELAHMWFGNLVTMSWWTHLWLNEGFATFVEYLCVDHCFPNFDIWTQFVCNELATALSLDSLRNSHAIEIDVRSPQEVDEIFDTISYAKGATIIRMLDDWIGREAFKTGLTAYLKKFSYANAATEDLWDALEESSGQPVAEVMSRWTRQVGYPVLTVKPIAPSPGAGESNGTAVGRGVTQAITITQSRFLTAGKPAESDTCSWIIPVTICRADSDDVVLKRILLRPPNNEVSSTVVEWNPKAEDANNRDSCMGAITSQDGIRLNPAAKGFYRVAYAPELMPAIMTALANGTVSPHARLSFLEDQFALSRSGHITILSLFDTLRAFAGESDYTVWLSLSTGLAQMRNLIQEQAYALAGYDTCAKLDCAAAVKFVSKAEQGLRQIVLDLARPVYKKLTWTPSENEPHTSKLLRPLIIAILGYNRDETVVKQSAEAFNKHADEVLDASKSKREPKQELLVPADLRSAVYNVCMATGGRPNMFDCVIELYKCATIQDERVRLLNCLGASTDLSVLGLKRDFGQADTTAGLHTLGKLFDFAISNDVRNQDRHCVMMGCMQNAYSRRMLWQFVSDNIDKLKDWLNSNYLVAHVIKGSMKNMATTERLSECKALFDKVTVCCPRSVQQGLELIEISIAQLKRNGDAHLTMLGNNVAA